MENHRIGEIVYKIFKTISFILDDSFFLSVTKEKFLQKNCFFFFFLFSVPIKVNKNRIMFILKKKKNIKIFAEVRVQT